VCVHPIGRADTSSQLSECTTNRLHSETPVRADQLEYALYKAKLSAPDYPEF
jgi:hypothetical protein